MLRKRFLRGYQQAVSNEPRSLMRVAGVLQRVLTLECDSHQSWNEKQSNVASVHVPSGERLSRRKSCMAITISSKIRSFQHNTTRERRWHRWYCTLLPKMRRRGFHVLGKPQPRRGAQPTAEDATHSRSTGPARLLSVLIRPQPASSSNGRPIHDAAACMLARHMTDRLARGCE